jgi:uroporphyrinogen decarboxylase
MTSQERFLAALNFQTPDRIPRCDYFIGTFPETWRQHLGLDASMDPMDYYGIDITEMVGNEEFMPSRSRKLSEDADYETWLDGWGTIKRVGKQDSYFFQHVGSLLETYADLDKLEFDAVTEPSRFLTLPAQMEKHGRVGRCVLAKSGGIYIRSHFLRGEAQLLMDMALEESFCDALFDKVAAHLERLSLETLRYTGTMDSGLLICDDMASSLQPMFSPAMFDRYFAPRYKAWIERVKAAGCKHVYFHSDGNILPVLGSLIEAGFAGVNPLEPRCGIDLISLRKKLGNKLLFMGGVCNTQVLPRGDRKEIEAHVRPLLEMGRDGGLVIGAASINGDVAPDAYAYYHSLCVKYGTYS